MQKDPQVMQALPKGRYEACWFFEYLDGKEKKGIFNYAGKGKDTAFAQSKTNLLRAGIIARDGNGMRKKIIMCSHEDFCNFEWVANKKMLSGVSGLQGLTLVTRQERATFFFDGSVEVYKRDNSEDKLFHYGR